MKIIIGTRIREEENIFLKSPYFYNNRDNFGETVKKVNAEMNKKKDYYPGLNRLPTLSLLFKTLPFSRMKEIVKSN